jgi:hypothetical protein
VVIGDGGEVFGERNGVPEVVEEEADIQRGRAALLPGVDGGRD